MAQKRGHYTIYLIGSDNSAIKIGYASNIKKRLASLQTGSPHELIVLWEFTGLTETEARKIERAAHEALKAKRLKGEWFDVTLDEAIDAVWSNINSRVYSARILAGFDLRGHLEPGNIAEIHTISSQDISNGSQVHTV
jgi:predicted GIY-YIG superfamily endonuclease